MKELNELDLPGDRSYTEDHEWISLNGDIATIGITIASYATGSK